MERYSADPYRGDSIFPLCLLFDGQDQPAVFYGDVKVWMAWKEILRLNAPGQRTGPELYWI